jgi:hypothetical protein
MKFTCIQHGATVNKDRDKEILIRLRDSFCRKHPELWRRKNLHMTMPLHIALFLSKRNWQGNRSPFCYTLHTHLISHHTFFSLSPLESKATWSQISVLQRGRQCRIITCNITNLSVSLKWIYTIEGSTSNAGTSKCRDHSSQDPSTAELRTHLLAVLTVG